jgi:imidazolonepropionase-like amidohydrolase
MSSFLWAELLFSSNCRVCSAGDPISMTTRTRKMRTRKTWLAPILFLLFLPALSFAAEESVYLVAGAMVDTLNGQRVSDPVVEISDGRIVSVKPGGTVPADARVIDLGEATILPGLADMHTHLTGYSTDFGYESLAISKTDSAIRGVVNARKTLMIGFTVARNLGAPGYSDVSLRNAIDAGRIPGPRLQVSGPSLGSTGGHCDMNKLPSDFDASSEGAADGPWAARAKVRQNKKYGADVIKFCATGGVLSKGTNPGARQYTLEEMEAIVDEAHSLGMPVAAHAHGTEGIYFAIKAGVDSIEHSSLIDKEGMKLAKQNGTFLSFNAFTPIYMVANGEAMGILPESLEKARNLKEKRLHTYRDAIKANANIVFGSDSATYPHGMNGKQFAVYVDLGMTPMQAIQSATTVAAESLGWVGDTGAIASGYFADIIAVEGDPLENIEEMENVIFVMKGGEVFKSNNRRIQIAQSK